MHMCMLIFEGVYAQATPIPGIIIDVCYFIRNRPVPPFFFGIAYSNTEGEKGYDEPMRFRKPKMRLQSNSTDVNNSRKGSMFIHPGTYHLILYIQEPNEIYHFLCIMFWAVFK
jgi:hypothetical protein